MHLPSSTISPISTPTPDFSDPLVVSIPPTLPSLRTTSSGRTVKPPAHLSDYIYGTAISSCIYPISNYVSFSNLSPSYSSFIAAITVIPEPSSYAKASTAEWRDAMKLELDALQNNKTWSLVPYQLARLLLGANGFIR